MNLTPHDGRPLQSSFGMSLGAHRARMRPSRARVIRLCALVAVAAATLGGCVENDSLRSFFGRESLTLRPLTPQAPQTGSTIATADSQGDH